MTKELNLNNRVHFLGVRSDVASLLKTADICVVSSHWEGFGLAAVEGMAAGVPVVASNIPGVSEVVRDAGVLFKKGDEKDLAEKIENLLEDKNYYAAVAKSCRERANQYSIDKMADGYVNLYFNLLK